jgi:hypothetical protein
MPIMIAPAALGKLLHPDGEKVTVTAARDANVLQVCSFLQRFVTVLCDMVRPEARSHFTPICSGAHTFDIAPSTPCILYQRTDLPFTTGIELFLVLDDGGGGRAEGSGAGYVVSALRK